MINWELTDIQTLSQEFHDLSIQLYELYMKPWNCNKSTFFDNSIREYRSFIKNNYRDDEDLNKCFLDIPLSFRDNKSGYWDEIIHKSNRYIPVTEDHYRCLEEEGYIRELITSIKQFVYVKYHKIRFKKVDKLILLVLAFIIRDDFISWIDFLDKYNKIEYEEDFNSYDEMTGSAMQLLIKNDLNDIITKYNQYQYKNIKISDEIKDLVKINTALINVIHVWYCIKNIPITKPTIESVLNLVNYCSNLKLNNNYIVGCKLLNELTNHSNKIKSLTDILNITLNSQDDIISQATNINKEIETIQKNIKLDIEALNSEDIPDINTSTTPRLKPSTISISDIPEEFNISSPRSNRCSPRHSSSDNIINKPNDINRPNDISISRTRSKSIENIIYKTSDTVVKNSSSSSSPKPTKNKKSLFKIF